MKQNNENFDNGDVAEDERKESGGENERVDGASVTVRDEAASQGRDIEAKSAVRSADGSGRAVIALKKFGKAAWEYIKHAKIELLVIAGLLILDLVTKALIAQFMNVGDRIPIIPQLLNITYVRNTKAAFGSAFGLEKVLSDDAIRIIFLVITLIALGVFSYILYRCRKRHLLMRLGIALIISGALGNFIDRAALHYVRDFIEIEFLGCDLPLLGTSFPVFNVADMGLTVGVILFLVYFIAIYKEPKSRPATQTVTEVTESSETDDDAEKAEETKVEPATDTESSGSENEKTGGGDE